MDVLIITICCFWSSHTIQMFTRTHTTRREIWVKHGHEFGDRNNRNISNLRKKRANIAKWKLTGRLKSTMLTAIWKKKLNITRKQNGKAFQHLPSICGNGWAPAIRTMIRKWRKSIERRTLWYPRLMSSTLLPCLRTSFHRSWLDPMCLRWTLSFIQNFRNKSFTFLRKSKKKKKK